MVGILDNFVSVIIIWNIIWNYPILHHGKAALDALHFVFTYSFLPFKFRYGHPAFETFHPRFHCRSARSADRYEVMPQSGYEAFRTHLICILDSFHTVFNSRISSSGMNVNTSPHGKSTLIARLSFLIKRVVPNVMTSGISTRS